MKGVNAVARSCFRLQHPAPRIGYELLIFVREDLHIIIIFIKKRILIIERCYFHLSSFKVCAR